VAQHFARPLPVAAMPDNSVVNLLDLRDEEEAKASGGRWASRNPKASAKGGRRQRKKPGNGGKMERKGSTMSDASMSDAGSEYDEERPPADAQPKPPAEPPAPVDDAPVAARASNPLLARLSNKNQEDQKTELLAAVAPPLPPEAPDTHNIEVGDMIDANKSDDGEGNVFEEAKKVARNREVLRDEPNGLEGKDFKRKYWEYYMVKETFSDGLCVALNHMYLVPWCVIPCLWPVRLFNTIRRAAPVKIKMCFCTCPVGACCAVPIVSIIFTLPILAGLTFVPAISTTMKDNFKNIPVLKDEDPDTAALYVSIGLVALSLLLMVFWWARILLGVAQKYQIKAAMDKPNSFVTQMLCCICAYNIRTAVHVDRAQGFMPPVKADKTTVELSDQLRLVNPAQNVMG